MKKKNETKSKFPEIFEKDFQLNFKVFLFKMHTDELLNLYTKHVSFSSQVLHKPLWFLIVSFTYSLSGKLKQLP